MYKYQTRFNLLAAVLDIDAAQAYLSEADMLEYFDNEAIKRKLKSIDWILEDDVSGYIEVIANEELSDDELEEIADYIKGQNSDGLGEGFSSQDFANYDANLYALSGEEIREYEEDGDLEEDWVSASFDPYREYHLELVESD